VPEELADRYRLYLSLRAGRKPVVTGTFAVEGFAPMHAMLSAVRGGEEELRLRPLAIFDACPSPPLRWSQLTCQALLDCARAGVPAEMVSMPLAGATAPATLEGAVAQHAAECLSGVVIHQIAGPGSPIIYGGSPAAFDMRHGTTPMGAVETMMIDVAYGEVGRSLGLPTHAYMALSDSRAVDAQAGLETSAGAMLAALAGIDVVSGPGMLDFESCQSLEKLVIDHEICAMALRLRQGIAEQPAEEAAAVVAEGVAAGHFLSLDHTMAHFRTEVTRPGPVIGRKARGPGAEGEGDALARAHREVERLLEAQKPAPLPEDVDRELRRIMETEAKAFGLGALPELEL
jgi:trimethylamine--corrinoid protein Co-methyltransferase